MGIGLLAPVPWVHLASAMATCKQHGKVAFGSAADAIFEHRGRPINQHAGCRVLIYATRPDLGEEGDML